MDFFKNQDSARRNSKFLVVLFLATVIFFIALFNWLVAFFLWTSNSNNLLEPSLVDFYTWPILGRVSLAVTIVIGCAIAYKWVRLSEGGKVVAESLGGRRVSPNSSSLPERRFLNVVEEMALAAGMPVPPVYLLDNERGVNAFAAGNTVADAVIGITAGSLKLLSRDQLQGVVAHEFSHILNGDMRLNFRLIALLNGIVFIGGLGQFFLRGGRFGFSSRRSSDYRILLLGLGLAIFGWIGVFFGGLIKAAINRQREYLADASAVQFTRNPEGIGGALKVIGGFSAGSRVLSANAGECSHMFIGNALNELFSLNTHPPLEERIRRIEPGWNGEMVMQPRKPVSEKSVKVDKVAAKKAAAIAVGLTLATGLAAKKRDESSLSRPDVAGIPAELSDKLREPFIAMAMVYALFLDNQHDEILTKQLSDIKKHGAKGAAKLASLIQKKIYDIAPAQRIPLVEKAMPALKCMSQNQYGVFKGVLVKLIHADRKVELFEWCIFQMIRYYLGAEFGERIKRKPRYKTTAEVVDDYSLVLSVLIHHGHLDPETSKRAFTRGANTAACYTAKFKNKDQCSMKGFFKAVNKLADCYPLLKSRLLNGMVKTTETDGVISPMEKELIISIAAVMDCPIPRSQI